MFIGHPLRTLERDGLSASCFERANGGLDVQIDDSRNARLPADLR